MRECKGNTFLYFGDKNVSRVSGIWKGLHITFYVAIAVNAFISSMAAGNVFQTFKYNCILFCSDLVFEKGPLLNDFIPFELSESLENSTKLNQISFGENTTDIFVNDTDLIETSTVDSRIEEKNDGTVIFKNKSHVFLNEGGSIVMIRAKIDVRRTIFASNSYCNFVLGVSLGTFIFATFCIILLAMCPKGGNGDTNKTLKKPQNMVYPILFTSIILGIINLIASIILKTGLNRFCENFEVFSGQKSCTSMVNTFTLHERQSNFYLPYLVLCHTFDLTFIFFACQIIVTLLRIVYAVDYQLYIIEENEEENRLNDEDREATL